MQHQTQTKLREENEALQRRVQKTDQLAAENERLSSLLARATSVVPAPTNDPSREVLRLRGEVGRLRHEQASDAAARKTNAPSPLSSLSSPEMVKLIRNQQKTGMTMIYKEFAKRANLTPDQTDKLNHLLAD